MFTSRKLIKVLVWPSCLSGRGSTGNVYKRQILGEDIYSLWMFSSRNTVNNNSFQQGGVVAQDQPIYGVVLCSNNELRIVYPNFIIINFTLRNV